MSAAPSWLDAASTATTTLAADATVLRDTARTGLVGGTATVHASAYARLVVDTDAASLDVAYYGQRATADYPGAHLAVYCAGSLVTTLAVVAGAQTSGTIALPGSGTRRVVVVGSYAQFDLGNYVTSITVPVGTRRVRVVGDGDDLPSTGRRVCLVGDSILSGIAVVAGVIQPATVTGSPATLLRARGYQVTSETSGGASLHTWGPDDGTRATLVARIAVATPDDVWIGLGTNDFGGDGSEDWTAAAFGTAYGATLDALHVALPAARVWCATPTTISTEATPGVAGDTIAAFRSAIATQVATRTAYARLVVGTALGTADDLSSDGTHLTPAGVAAYGGRVGAALDAA